MRLYPAIDLKDGKCVRLHKGEMRNATVYNDNALQQGITFQNMGFSYLHVVDLNGAVSGVSANRGMVEKLLKGITIPVQLGGGIRDRAGVEAWLEAGVARVILGTAALKNPVLVREVARAYPGKIVVGLDARNGQIATDGWIENSGVPTIDVARRFEDVGVAAIIHTDIDRDGMLGGPNLEATSELAKAVSIPVILSGGIGRTEDIRAAADNGHIEGVIIGRALYERTMDIREAIAISMKSPGTPKPPAPSTQSGDVW